MWNECNKLRKQEGSRQRQGAGSRLNPVSVLTLWGLSPSVSQCPHTSVQTPHLQSEKKAFIWLLLSSYFLQDYKCCIC